MRVKVTDAAGDIVADGTLVELESRDGSLEPARARTARGHVVAYFTQRPGLAPGVARVTAHAYEGGDLTPAFGHPSPTREGLNTTSLPNRVPPLLWERGGRRPG